MGWLQSLQRDRSQIPDVVIPLADAQNSIPLAEKDANSLDSQEKGAGFATDCSTLTLEALRAEVDSSVAASGHNSVYDRMFLLPRWGTCSAPNEPAIAPMPLLPTPTLPPPNISFHFP